MVLGAVYSPQPQYPVNPLRSAPAAPYPTMRYYRLWIYTCNALLFMSAIGFSIVLAKVLILDPRRQLVPTISLAQPSFLYAYAALLFQSGVLQTIGCLGASRLNDRLLNIYLLLLLVLLLGDILLGVVWLFKYDKISTDLRPLLNHSFVLRYGVDSEFTALWDAVQSQYRCCGVYGYADFLQYNLTVDTGLAGSPAPVGTIALPKSCCRESPLVAAALRNFHYAVSTSTTTASPSSPGAAHIVTRTAASRPATLGSRAADERRCATGGLIHQQNCHRILLDWVNSTAHILFVLGYCVIAFIKLCFLGILRYEIREMIQKIKLVQESERAEGAELAKTAKQNNGTILQAVQSHSIERKHSIIYAPDDDRIMSKRVAVIKLYSDDFMEVEVRDGGESERKSNTTKPDKRHVSNVLQDAGTDSDTNSHCALILNDASDTPAHTGGTAGQTTGTNGNNNYEMGDLSGHRPRT